MVKTKGRMIRKDISRSRKIGQLSAESLSLFALILPHLNGHGKANGNPHFVKGEIAPLIDWLTIPKIEKCLAEIGAKTNLKWFRVGGLHYLHSLNWSEHQDLRDDRLGEDRFPDYPGNGGNNGALPDNSGSTPGIVRPEVEVEVEEEGEEKHTRARGKKREEKIQFAEFVTLTQAEHDKLCSEYGPTVTDALIETLDNYKGAHEKRYKSDYRAILSWVVKKVKEERAQPKRSNALDQILEVIDEPEGSSEAGLHGRRLLPGATGPGRKVG